MSGRCNNGMGQLHVPRDQCVHVPMCACVGVGGGGGARARVCVCLCETIFDVSFKVRVIGQG